MRLLRLAAALTLAAAILPAAASAATVANDGYGLQYAAAAGEVNDLIITATTADWVFTENTGVPIAAGATCRRGASASQALCAKSVRDDFTIVHLGDRDDRAQPEEGFFGTIHGDAGADLLLGSPNGGRLDGGAGADDIECRSYVCEMRGGPGPDHMRGVIDPKSPYPSGGGEVSYEDHVAGVTVTLDGVNNDGNATDGPAGARDNVAAVHGVIGSPGNDRLTDGAPQGPYETHVLNGLAGDDELRGLGGRDLIHGGDGVDRLYGGDGGDNLIPDDELLAGPGPAGDVISGGNDTDLVYYRRPVGVRISLNGVADDGRDADGDEVAEERDNVLADVEDVLAGDGDDVLQGSASGNLLAGYEGHDRISGGGGADRLFGVDGDDKLDGGAQDDELRGGTGDDVLSGGSDVDRLFGENDHDSVDGGTGADFLSGGFGLDTVSYAARTAPVAVTMAGGADDGADTDGDGDGDEGDDVRTDVEHFAGGSAADRVTGNAAANKLFGGAGGDRMDGMGGNDVLDGQAGGDTLDGGTGDDRFLQGKLPDGPDAMTGGIGTDFADYSGRVGRVVVTLNSLAGDGDAASAERDDVRADVERVTSGAGDDTLTGNGFANVLRGLGGADILTGGGAVDLLYGGDGDDDLFSRGDGAADTAACQGGTADEITADRGDTVSDCEIAH